MLNLRGVDLNLLTVFEAVYEERNQARAAERLAMTQPAVSNAIARLRLVVKDKLFVSVEKGVQPTAQADMLYGQVHLALGLVREGLGEFRDFQPATTQRKFSLAITYTGGAVFVADLYRGLKREAPNARLSIRALDCADEVPRMLREGQLDLAVDYVYFDDASLVHEVLFESKLVIIARTGHPRLQANLTWEMIQDEEFVSHYEPHSDYVAPEMERSLTALGHRTVIEVPTALALPIVVSQTDLIAVTTERLANMTAGRYALNIFPLPFDGPPIPSYLIWHRARERDSGHIWLREQMKNMVAGVAG